MNYSIGQNIKSDRKQLGLTQEELASQLFVTAQAVSKWKSDAGMPDTAQIFLLAKALNIPTDALFGLDNGNYDEAREHIAKLPGIESNMLQENFLPYLVYAEDGQRRVDEPLGKLKAWNGEDSKLYKDFCVKAGL